MKTILYFAYGSNLDVAQMARRCPEAALVGPAILPGHALGFAGHSASWGGAVATVSRCEGRSVPGLLFRLTESDLEALDRFEGYPWAYTRRQRLVTSASGQRHRALVYFKEDGIARMPSPEYVDVIHDAYIQHGFGRVDLARAIVDAARSKTSVFVYGTLRRGQSNHRLLAHVTKMAPARTEARFTMVSLGAFPGMVRGGRTAVVGEVYDVDGDTLESLDRLEGHPRFYRRSTVRLDNGREVAAYLLSSAQVGGCPVIPSGDWTKRKENSRCAFA